MQSSCSPKASPSSPSTKAITTLNLCETDLGAEGVTHLADALEINRVRRVICSHPAHPSSSFLYKTLHNLDMQVHGLGAEGIRPLAKALEVNQVRSMAPVYPRFLYVFNILIRHSTL